ncbi:MAG: hypothetical protein ACRDK2_04715 [Solirubrobacteraceae bacterium]
MSTPTFITLGPQGTCHEHALLAYLEFQGLQDAHVELVEDFLVGLERMRELANGFLVQCSSHPDVHIVTERYHQEVFVIDTFMFPAKEMGLIVRRDAAQPKSLGVVPAAMGYPDLSEWETVVKERANPIVARELLGGKYDAGVTFVAFGEEHPEELSVRERYGEVDTTWLVYGLRRRYDGQLIGHRVPWLFSERATSERSLQMATRR